MKLIFLIPVILFFTSCSLISKKEPPIPAPPQQQRSFQTLQRKVLQNPNNANIQKLINFIEQNPKSSLNDDAAILLGKTYYKRQQYLKAYNSYMSIIRSDVLSPMEADAFLGAAHSLNKRGQYDEALSLCEKGLDLNPSLKLQTQFNKLTYNINKNIGNNGKALDALIGLYENETNTQQKQAYFAEALSIIENKLNSKELEHVIDYYQNNKLQSVAHLKLGEHYLDQQDYEKAGESFEEVLALTPNTEWSDLADGYLNQIFGQSKVSSNTIGVILPLSGKHKKVGEKVLNGLQLGLGIFGSKRTPIKLAIIDSQTSPDIARRAVVRLVQENHVIGIVGGLLSRTSVAIASKCNEMGVPNISLSQKSDLTEIGSYIFRNALTSEMQVQFLVQNALKQGITKFAALYPKDSYGKEYFNLFWDEVKKQGGKVVAVQSYEPKETDFNKYVKKLVGTYYIKDRQKEYNRLVKEWKAKNGGSRKKMPKDLLPPIVKFQALFIPDNTKAIGQIAPTLAYNSVKNVKLIGTNLWNTPSFIKRGQRYVENALFVDSQLSKPSRLASTRFYTDFSNFFQRKPSQFEAQGYDTGRIILRALGQGESSRKDLRRKLSNMEAYNGVGGTLTTQNREFLPPLVLLTVKERAIVPFQQ